MNAVLKPAPITASVTVYWNGERKRWGVKSVDAMFGTHYYPCESLREAVRFGRGMARSLKVCCMFILKDQRGTVVAERVVS